MFKEFFMIFSIIIVHELGHLLAAQYYNWNLGKIAVYPFGGCVKFNEKLTRPLKEELIILLSGPLMQIIFFIFISILEQNGFMTYRNFLLFSSYHYTLLIFNLLPIYPLDGGRILNLFLNFFLPFKKGNKIAIIIGVIIIIIAVFLYQNINFILMGILLFCELLLYLKRQPYLYNKLLLEKYMQNKNYKKMKIIKNKDSMYKEKRHIILYKNKYITEKDYLNQRFKVIK